MLFFFIPRVSLSYLVKLSYFNYSTYLLSSVWLHIDNTNY